MSINFEISYNQANEELKELRRQYEINPVAKIGYKIIELEEYMEQLVIEEIEQKIDSMNFDL